MAGSYHAGTALIDVLPSMKRFHSTIRSDLRGINPTVTVDVVPELKNMRRQFARGVGKIPPIKVDVDVNTAALRKAEQDVVGAEKRMSTARDNAKDAAARLDIAEKQLGETRSRSRVKASQIAAAELKVAQAKRTVAAASNDARNAETALSSARSQVRDIKARIDVDTGGAAAKMAAFNTWAAGLLHLHGSVDLDIGAALAKLAVFGAKGTAVSGAMAGIGAAAGGAFVAIPALTAAAGAGVGTLVVGLNGTVDAFKAFSDADKQAAQNATANAKQQTAAARQIASAQQQVTQAKTAQARTQQDADWAAAASVRRVQDAERQLVSAQRASLQAQQDLTRARDDAKRAMRDLQFQVEGGALAERQAVLDLADARAELDTARAAGAGGPALARAQVGYDQQALSLKEIRARNADLAKEKATSDRAGVAGSEQVVAAHERVRAAVESEGDARRGVQDAGREATQQQIQSQRSIADAQLQVTQAQIQLGQAIQDAGTIGAASVDKINAAMAELSPNARQFVTDVRSLKPAFEAVGDSVQDKLFANLGPAFTGFARQILPEVQTNLGLVAGSINGLTRDMLAYGATQQVAAQMQSIFAGTAQAIDASGPALQSISNLLLSLASAAMPGLTLIIQAVGSLADSILTALQPLIDSGAINTAMSLIAQLIVALGPLIGEILAVAIQLWNALGPSLIAVIQALTPVFTALGAILVQMAPYIGQIATLLVNALLPIMQALAPVIAALMPVITQLISMALQLLIPIIDVLADVFMALWPTVEAVIAALMPLIPIVAQLISAVAPLITQLVSMFAPILSQLATILSGVLQQALVALMPLLPVLFDLFTQIFNAVLPFIPVFVEFAAQIIAAVLPALVALAPIVTMLISAFAPLIPQLMQLAMMLLPLLVSIVQTLMPIIVLLANIFGQVLGIALRVIVVPLLSLVINVVRAVVAVFQLLWSIAQPIFQAIGAAGTWLYEKALKPAFDGINAAIDGVIGFFTKMGDVIGGIWQGIKNLVHDGIQGVIDLIYNFGIRALVNAVIDYIPGLDPLPELKVPEFARGGVLPGYAPGRDIVPSLLSPGEAVLVPELVRLIGPDVIDAANASAMRGRAYSRGGMVGGLARFAEGGVVGGVVGGDGASMPAAATAVTIDPAALAALGAVADAVTAQIGALTTQINLVLVPALTGLDLHTRTTAGGIVAAYNLVWARQLLLQTQYTTSWAAITATVTTSTRGQATAFTTLVNGMAAVRAAITQTAGAASTEFARIRAAAADPIRWVLQHPFNAGIIAGWNRLNSDFALKKPVKAIPIPFRIGGRVPGMGNRDSVDAKLTPGEYVFSKPAIAGLGGLDSVDRLHRMARAGLVGPDQRLGRPGDAALRQRLMRSVPLDGLGFAFGGVVPHVAAAGQEIERKFGHLPGGVGGVGARPNASDHPFGLALDFMTMSDTALGNKIAGYLESNARRLLLKYLIWQQRFNDGDGWTAMEDRGSPTANHMDHVHASFLKLGQLGRVFSGAGGPLDVASYFDSARKMLGQITGRFPGNQMAIRGAGVGNIALKSVISAAEAMSSLTADASTAGSPQVKAAVRSVAAGFGWGSGAQWNALDWLIGHESGWNPAARNPTSSASGLFQKMVSVHGPLEPTVAGQAKWGLNYIRSRYTDPLGAQRWWQAHHWYDAGGIATGAGLLVKNTPAPERVLSPGQTRSFDTLVSHIGAGRTLTAQPVGAGGGRFTGELYLDSGELLGVVDGRIDQANNDVGSALLRGRRP